MEFRTVDCRFNKCLSVYNPCSAYAKLSIYYLNELCVLVIKIWKQKLVQMGATIEERLSKKVTHVFAMDLEALLQQIDRERLARFKGVSSVS